MVFRRILDPILTIPNNIDKIYTINKLYKQYEEADIVKKIF